MEYFANPSTQTVRDAMTAGLLNMIDTPKQGNRRPEGVRWCADNGVFGKGYPGDDKWFGWLIEHRHDAATCVFAVAPDVVGDASGTLARSEQWLPKIRELGYPAAFVAQNGAEHTVVPWDAFDVLFIGGSAECISCGYVKPATAEERKRKHCPNCGLLLTEWKLGAIARALVAEAKVRGKHVHMGRVNSERRLRYAMHIGCDSADGTYITFGADVNLPNVLAWLRGTSQPRLFDEVPA